MAALEASKIDVPLAQREQKIIGIWDWDVPNDLNHMDAGCAVAFGATPEQGRLGMPNDAFLTVVHPHDLRFALTALATSLTVGGVYETSYRIITEDRER
jgi:PAS domain-containing protein